MQGKSRACERALSAEGGSSFWHGGDAAYPRTLTACADVLEMVGWTKAAFPVREGSFAEEGGFRAKRARAEESRGWFLVVFFQRRC